MLLRHLRGCLFVAEVVAVAVVFAVVVAVVAKFAVVVAIVAIEGQDRLSQPGQLEVAHWQQLLRPQRQQLAGRLRQGLPRRVLAASFPASQPPVI